MFTVAVRKLKFMMAVFFWPFSPTLNVITVDILVVHSVYYYCYYYYRRYLTCRGVVIVVDSVLGPSAALPSTLPTYCPY